MQHSTEEMQGTRRSHFTRQGRQRKTMGGVLIVDTEGITDREIGQLNNNGALLAEKLFPFEWKCAAS